MLAMIQVIQEINALKIGVLGVPNGFSDGFVKLPSEGEDGTEAQAGEDAKAPQQSADVAEFGLKFTVPKVCLTLKTRKKAISSRLSSHSNEWELQTYLE